MFRRSLTVIALALLVAGMASCHNKRVKNPIANVDSKQPDKVLFDRAMEALKHNKYDVARMTLQTLINTYPDSEYVARAKLGVGDSWYAEGGGAALAQAESEYKDFITFFPNMPEAAEAQLKIAGIHFQQMEKPDRDFTHAKRAEDEYRQLILQFPDSKLVPEAKEKLRQVQEVLAEREFRIGRFYYLRQSWSAGVARLKSLADTYPLYSQADETLFMLGNAYEGQITDIRNSRLDEVAKGKAIKMLEDKAADAYARIVSRYPAMNRAGDAKARLEALRRPVPKPTDAAIAQNKAEEASRREMGMFGRMMLNLHKRPDVSQAAKVGEPTLVDPQQTSAPEVARQMQAAAGLKTGDAGSGANTVTVETVKEGTPGENQPVPRSDAQGNKPDSTGIPELKPNVPGGGTQPTESTPSTQPGGGTQPPPQAGAQPTPQGVDATGHPPAAPQQVNDAATADTQASQGTGSQSQTTSSQNTSSSKKNKKKGLRKIVPF